MSTTDRKAVIMGSSSEVQDRRRLLALYLRDHRAGAEAGLALIARCRRANEGTGLGEVLVDIEREITKDRDALADIMQRLEVGESQVKKIAARAAEAIGRVKSNGRIRSYSPSSRVLELEGLMAGIDAKQSLWRSLRSAVPSHTELDGGALDQLLERATSQRDRLATEHRRAAANAFAGAD